jgi:hypothetical protein
MSRRWYRQGRPRTGHLDITYEPDPFRLKPDLSRTSGIKSHADLVRQAEHLRQQGIISTPPIVQSELFIGSFQTTLDNAGWFPDVIQLNVGDHYPPGVVMFAFTLQWSGELNGNTNMRVTNADESTAQMTAVTLGANFHVYLLWVFPGGAMPSTNLGSFVLAQRTRADLSVYAHDFASVALVQPLTLSVQFYFNKPGVEVTTSVYGNLAKHSSG